MPDNAVSVRVSFIFFCFRVVSVYPSIRLFYCRRMLTRRACTVKGITKHYTAAKLVNNPRRDGQTLKMGCDVKARATPLGRAVLKPYPEVIGPFVRIQAYI